MEERSAIWRVAANILNKQSRTADKCAPPSWGLHAERTCSTHGGEDRCIQGFGGET